MTKTFNNDTRTPVEPPPGSPLPDPSTATVREWRWLNRAALIGVAVICTDEPFTQWLIHIGPDGDDMVTCGPTYTAAETALYAKMQALARQRWAAERDEVRGLA